MVFPFVLKFYYFLITECIFRAFLLNNFLNYTLWLKQDISCNGVLNLHKVELNRIFIHRRHRHQLLLPPDRLSVSVLPGFLQSSGLLLYVFCESHWVLSRELCHWTVTFIACLPADILRVLTITEFADSIQKMSSHVLIAI